MGQEVTDADQPLDPREFPHELGVDDPAEMYRQLPRETRKWLEKKKPEDLASLDVLIKAIEMGKWNAKVIAYLVGLFVATVGLIVSVKTVLSWFPGAGR